MKREEAKRFSVLEMSVFTNCSVRIGWHMELMHLAKCNKTSAQGKQKYMRYFKHIARITEIIERSRPLWKATSKVDDQRDNPRLDGPTITSDQKIHLPRNILSSLRLRDIDRSSRWKTWCYHIALRRMMDRREGDEIFTMQMKAPVFPVCVCPSRGHIQVIENTEKLDLFLIRVRERVWKVAIETIWTWKRY